MRLEGQIYRPPSEAQSLLLQLTVGCSHNRCAFCAMYSDKRYRVRPVEEVLEDVEAAASALPHTRRIFLCDGDALSAGFAPFYEVCDKINACFPELGRISAYVNARDILNLSQEERIALRALKFSLGYLGLESGSTAVLERIRKGATPEDMTAMARAAREANIDLSVIVLLGAGGQDLSASHVAGTIKTVNAMQPRFLSFLTAMIVPQTPLMTWTQKGEFQPLTDRAILREARDMIAGLDLRRTVFRMNHVSNLMPLGGRLPKEKAKMRAQLDAMIPHALERVTCVITEAEGLRL